MHVLLRLLCPLAVLLVPAVAKADELDEVGADAELDAADRALARPRERVIGVPIELSVSGHRETTSRGAATAVMLLLRLPLAREALTRVSHVEALPPPPTARRLRLPARVVRETVKAALRANGLSPDRDSLAGMSARARGSAVLPELRFRVVRGLDQSLRLSPTDADPYRTQATDGASMLYEARATWRLDRLVFADEEVAIERLRCERAAERRKLTHQVLDVLATYQRARPTAGGSVEEREERASRGAAASVTLDGLTDGLWSTLLAGMEPDEVVP